MKKKMGRPKKDDPKCRSLTIRMTRETHEKLTRYAADHNETMTEVALRSLEDYLSRKN